MSFARKFSNPPHSTDLTTSNYYTRFSTMVFASKRTMNSSMPNCNFFKHGIEINGGTMIIVTELMTDMRAWFNEAMFQKLLNVPSIMTPHE